MASFVTGLVIAAWYLSNIGVVMLNKYLLSIFNYKFPVFLTLLHMVTCSVLSSSVAATKLLPVQPVRSRRHFGKIAFLAAIFCITVVLGNVSLRYIPVSFNQAIGATTPAFTAVLHTVMTGRMESKQVYGTLVPIVAGIVIASGAEPLFHLIGFVAAVSAVAGRALKSVLQSIMLEDPADRMDSMSLLLYMAPVATVLLTPVVLAFENEAVMTTLEMSRSSGAFVALLLLNCILAYFANLTNFLVTKHTSALTLQVLGNAKGVVAVVVSVLYFRNPVNLFSILGYAITVGGVVAYSHVKKVQRKAALKTQLSQSVQKKEGLEYDVESSPLITADVSVAKDKEATVNGKESPKMS